MAGPEKALLDLLYLYPGYHTSKDMEDLRFDEDYLHDDLKRNLLLEYCNQYRSKALERRVQVLITTYGL
jgi:hypothetical protein